MKKALQEYEGLLSFCYLDKAQTKRANPKLRQGHHLTDLAHVVFRTASYHSLNMFWWLLLVNCLPQRQP